MIAPLTAKTDARVPEKAFYRRDADLFAPTGIGLSPWNGETQNGIALAGLVAFLFEEVSSAAPMQPARLQIDILGAVPMVPLSSRTRVVREGRRMQICEAELRADRRCWVRASMLRIRTTPTPVVEVPPLWNFPEEIAQGPLVTTRFAESYILRGGLRRPGPGARWIRLGVGVVEGVALTPFQAVAMVGDYGSGTAPLLPHVDWTMANVDISIHISRLPSGEWLLLDSTSESAGAGFGLVSSRLGDRSGMFGFAHQTIFIQRRPNE